MVNSTAVSKRSSKSLSKRSSKPNTTSGKDDHERLKGFVDSDSDDGFQSDRSFRIGDGEGSLTDTDSESESSFYSDDDHDGGVSDVSDASDYSTPPAKRKRKSPAKNERQQSLKDIDRLTAELGGDVGDGRTGHERRASAELDEFLEDIESGKAKANAKRKGNNPKTSKSSKTSKTSNSSKSKNKSRSTSRMSKDDHPDSLRQSMRPDELSLLDNIMADLEADGNGKTPPRRRSKRSRKPPRRYIDRRDVRKDVQNHYMDKSKPDSMDAYIKLLQEDVEKDPLMGRFVDETDQFSSDEGYDTEEERLGRRIRPTKPSTRSPSPSAKSRRSASDSSSGSDSESDSGSYDSNDAGSVDSRQQKSPKVKSPQQRFGNYPTSTGF